MTVEFSPSNNHWSMRPVGTFRERITRPQLKHLLLNIPDPIVKGNLMKWRHKHLGVGVYELWIEPKEAP